MQRQGIYPGAGPTPYVMGYECSGVVEEIGAGVTSVEVFGKGILIIIIILRRLSLTSNTDTRKLHIDGFT